MSTIPNSPPAIQRFFTSRDNNANSATYVGQEQRLWYDPVSNAIYVSDGNTAGGILVGGGGSGNGVPGGPTNSVQLNAGNGSFTGTSNLIFNGTTLSVVGNVSGTYFIGNGALLTGVSTSSYSNTNVASYLQVLTTDVSTTGNITGSYILGNGALLTGINANANYSNSNVASYLQVLTSNISTTGNVSASYYIGNGSALTGIVATNIGTLPSLSVTGNANVGNLNSAGLVSAPLIVASFFVGNGQGITGVVAQTGNITYANTTLLPTTTLDNIRLQTFDSANSITNNWVFDAAGNLSAPGSITAVGNITGNYFIGNGSQLTGIIANTIGTLGNLSVTGNANVGNVNTGGNITAVGNITGNYFIGNGSQLTGLTANTGNLQFSNTTIFPTTSLANIRLQTYDTANSITSNWVFGKNTLYLPNTSTVISNTQTTILTGDFASGNSSQIQLIPRQFSILSSDSSDPANTSYVSMSATSLKGNPYFEMSVSDPSQSTTQNWSFDKTGTLNLPSGGVIFDTPNGALAFGYQAGGGNANISQGNYGISIGASSGEYNQGDYSIALGYNAGNNIQGTNSIAIGKNAGGNNQGSNAIYIGGTANTTIQVNNSIVLNASGNSFNANAAGFFVKPLRNDNSNIGNVSFYNTNTGEVTYSNSISVTGNITANYIFGNGINLTGLANITFGSAPPANAIIGDTWIDSTTGIQYVYFNDITGEIWAEMEAQTSYASVGYANLTTNTLNTQVLYNASNAIVGSNNLTFDGTTLSAQGVTVGNALQISGNSIVSNTSNGNLTINTTGNRAYINMRGGLKLTSYNGNLLMETIDDTVNFYSPVLNSTESSVDIIGSLDGNSLSPNNIGVMLHVTGQQTLPSRIYNDAANTYAAYVGRAFNGNVNAPTAILANTTISRIGANPYSNTGFAPLTTTRIDMETTENQTTTNRGSQITFWATPTGSNVIAQLVSLNSTALSVSGNIIGGNVSTTGNVYANNIVGNTSFSGGYYGAFHTNYQTSLNGGINSNSTAPIVVTSTAGWPTTGALLIQQEVISYTGISGNTFTGITRGVSGTSGAVHANSTSVSFAQIAAANTATTMVLDQTDYSNGITVNASHEVTVVNAGLYNCQFSIQTMCGDNTADDIAVWFVVNGTAVPSSASYVTTPGAHAGHNGTAIMTVNIFHQFTAGQILTLQWVTLAGTSVITSYPSVISPAIPASPSVILTVNQIA